MAGYVRVSRETARRLCKHYSALVERLLAAQVALAEGGVKSYTVGDRSLTKFDLDSLTEEIGDALEKQAYYEAIASGKTPRKVVGVVPMNW